MLEAAAHLPRRPVRHGLPRDRQQPEEDGRGRHDHRRERDRDPPQITPLERGAGEEEAGERQDEEDRVRHVHEREREGGAGYRRAESRRGRVD